LSEQDVLHAEFTVVRRLGATPERVFAAFSNPAAKRRWFADPKGTALEEFAMDFRVDGQDRARYRMSAASPFPGAELSSVTTYLEIAENRRIVFAYSMAMEGRRFSASLATVELSAAIDGGTELRFTEQGAYFEGSDGPAMREAGWNKLLDSLQRESAG
jgi:uncharacterized protein YndB with AHSA1/START domain